MRLTRAHRLAASAIIVPLAIIVATAFLPFAGNPRADSSAAEHVYVFLTTSTFLGLITASLLLARPQSSWAKGVRSILLGLTVFVLVTASCMLVGAAFIRGQAMLAVYGLWFPAGLVVLWATFRQHLDDSGIAKEVPSLTPLKAMLQVLGPISVSFAVLLAFFLALRVLGVGAKAFGYVTPFIFLGFALAWLVSGVVTSLLNRGTPPMKGVAFSFTPWVSFHRWRPMPDAEADRAWNDAGRLPAGGRLEAGWTCDHCPMVRLRCRDREGLPYALYLRPPKLPWAEWLAGPFIARFDALPDGDSRLRAGLFQRLDCPWLPMPPEWLESRLGALAPNGASDRAVGWVCPDCGSERFDLVDPRGDDFLLVRNPVTEELRWAAGCFFAFSRRPTLASERPPQPTPANKPV